MIIRAQQERPVTESCSKYEYIIIPLADGTIPVVITEEYLSNYVCLLARNPQSTHFNLHLAISMAYFLDFGVRTYSRVHGRPKISYDHLRSKINSLLLS